LELCPENSHIKSLLLQGQQRIHFCLSLPFILIAVDKFLSEHQRYFFLLVHVPSGASNVPVVIIAEKIVVLLHSGSHWRKEHLLLRILNAMSVEVYLQSILLAHVRRHHFDGVEVFDLIAASRVQPLLVQRVWFLDVIGIAGLAGWVLIEDFLVLELHDDIRLAGALAFLVFLKHIQGVPGG